MVGRQMRLWLWHMLWVVLSCSAEHRLKIWFENLATPFQEFNRWFVYDVWQNYSTSSSDLLRVSLIHNHWWHEVPYKCVWCYLLSDVTTGKALSCGCILWVNCVVEREGSLKATIQIVHRVSKKLCQCYFVNNSVKHWPNLIIFGTHIAKKHGINDHSFAHLPLILLLHYLVKCRSCILDVYNNEFILGTALWDQKIIENLLLL